MKNRGFSLIELIVVVAIMGILLTFVALSITLIAKTNSHKCASEINSGLEVTRSMSYSSDSATDVVTVTFFKKRDGVYMQKSYESQEVKVGGSGVDVSVTFSDGTSQMVGEEGVTFSFNRSSGGFRDTNLGAQSGTCTLITVASGNRIYDITCYPHTGKTKLERRLS